MLNKVLNKVLTVLYENLKLIIIALISVILILMLTIFLSLSIGDDLARQPSISEIKGEGQVTRSNSRLTANKRMRLLSGDTVRTGEDSYIRVSIDEDKYIVLEENTVAQIFYTEVEGKGAIDVNVTQGAVLNRIDKPLKKNSAYRVKTPNAVVDVKEAVFRVSFDFAEKYMDYQDVFITEVQNFSGSAGLQLYDINAEPSDLPMLLIERASAKMITSPENCQYVFLNHDTDIYNLTERTLTELLRIRTDNRKLAYATEELNAAHSAVWRNNALIRQSEAESEAFELTAEPDTEFTLNSTFSVDNPPFEPSAGTASEPPPSVTESTQTSQATQRTHVYTTFPGEKWWETENDYTP
ncbi:MAG: FecR family protein [Oscillospiraceae bacterium]|nr:FecR family protein [Oscillospiraceae bacterium]